MNNVVAVFLLLLGMLAAIRAATPSRTIVTKNAAVNPDSNQANGAIRK
jgi:hypothetical protein